MSLKPERKAVIVKWLEQFQTNSQGENEDLKWPVSFFRINIHSGENGDVFEEDL